MKNENSCTSEICVTLLHYYESVTVTHRTSKSISAQEYFYSGGLKACIRSAAIICQCHHITETHL
jgi:hypothetical protein